MNEEFEAELRDRLGAVLTYKTSGCRRAHGQTIGADGAGEFSVLFMGSPDDADTAAREYLAKMQRAGMTIQSAMVVRNEPHFLGDSVLVMAAAQIRAELLK